MNRDETVALFLQGKEAWNAWTEKMLAERKAMEADGRWAAEEDDFGGLEPKNDETRAWMGAASADFSDCVFLIGGAENTREAAGETKEETDSVPPSTKRIFLNADAINFGGFVFPGVSWFSRTTFSGDADFSNATFSDDAYFNSVFTCDACFESAAFSRDANFRSVAFSSHANFQSATVTGYAYFDSAAFSGPADFRSAAFFSRTYFEHTAFSGNAYFGSATFRGRTTFGGAVFSGPAEFRSATFSGLTKFGSVVFSDTADFRSAAFFDSTYLQGATFSGRTNFESATFLDLAYFRGQTFANDIFFNGAKFGPRSNAYFGLVTFERVAQFDDAVFEGEANFNAVWGKRAFSMARARFKNVPNFIQAHFEQTPRLDNILVDGRILERREMPLQGDQKLPRRMKLHRWLGARSALYRNMLKMK